MRSMRGLFFKIYQTDICYISELQYLQVPITSGHPEGVERLVSSHLYHGFVFYKENKDLDINEFPTLQYNENYEGKTN